MPLENGEYVFDISDWELSDEDQSVFFQECADLTDAQARNRFVQKCVVSVAVGYEESSPIRSYMSFLQEVIGMLRMDMKEIRESKKLSALSPCNNVRYLRTLWSAILRARLVADVGMWTWSNTLADKKEVSQEDKKKLAQLGWFINPYLSQKDTDPKKKHSIFPEIFPLSKSAVQCLKILNDAANGIKHPKKYNTWRSLREEPSIIILSRHKKGKPVFQSVSDLVAGVDCFVLRLLVEIRKGAIQESRSSCVATY